MQNERTPQSADETTTNSQQQAPSKQENPIWELIKFSLIALLIVLPIRAFIAQPFVVSGSSMHPTFESGEYLIIDETYQFRTPQRGDVVVFRPPGYEDKKGIFFIKRIIGLPGETIELANGEVIIYNKTHPDGFKVSEPYTAGRTYDTLTTTLASDEYFVLGDNRNHSSDSRAWGALPEEMIVGRALIRVLPLSDARVLPGDFTK